jgi:hypothetical protein
LLLFGLGMVGGAVAEYAAMVTAVGRGFCWAAILCGLTLTLMSFCAFLNKAGSRRQRASLTRQLSQHSSRGLALCLFLLAQALFVTALGCFLAKHAVLSALHEYLDDEALQDLLEEYKHQAGCDEGDVGRGAGNSGATLASSPEVRDTDSCLPFRRQLHRACK